MQRLPSDPPCGGYQSHVDNVIWRYAEPPGARSCRPPARRAENHPSSINNAKNLATNLNLHVFYHENLLWYTKRTDLLGVPCQQNDESSFLLSSESSLIYKKNWPAQRVSSAERATARTQRGRQSVNFIICNAKFIMFNSKFSSLNGICITCFVRKLPL